MSGPAPFTVEHFRAWAAEVILDTGEPWVLEGFQEDFLADVFAGVPEVWLLIPEGNTKTTTVGGLGLYHCQFTQSAWVPAAASSREQAQILYRQAEGMVLRSRALRPVFRCYEGYLRIQSRDTPSRMQVMAADDRTGDGIIPTLGLVDELHQHRDLKLYRTWRGKLDKRGGQIVAISTAGEPGGEFEETRSAIRKQATSVQHDGSFTRYEAPGLVMQEWAVPQGADTESIRQVKQANPFSGVTEELLAAKRRSPTMTAGHWKRFVCNQPTRTREAAIMEPEWERAACAELLPAGVPVWAGLDVGWRWDTTALVPLWPRDPGFHLFGPATVLEPPRDGSSLEPELIHTAVRALDERNPIHTLVMDTSKAEDVAGWISSNLPDTLIVDRPQSNPFAVADYRAFMRGLRGGVLRHSGDRGLTEHAMNAIARTLPNGDARFDRPAQPRRVSETLVRRRVIDALTAAAMVYAAATDEIPEEEEDLVAGIVEVAL